MNLGQVLSLLQGGANPQNLLTQFLQQNPGMQAGLPLVKKQKPHAVTADVFQSLPRAWDRSATVCSDDGCETS